jgi:peptidyl-prolyl cis-trans isomerase A (cyclophilin A)
MSISRWAVSLLVLAACESSKPASKPEAENKPSLPSQPTSGQAAAAAKGEDPTGGNFTLAQALEGLGGSGQLMAKIETNMGTMVAKLYEDKTPNTVANFVGLARGTRPWRDPKSNEWVSKKPFYDGLTFHRVIPGFMIQGGDPLGMGTGGPGYKFADEIVPELKHDKPGMLSMANAGPVDRMSGKPGTNGSQFFVTEVPTPHLDGKHTVFGELVEGIDVQKKIATVKTGPGNRPLEPVVMQKVTIYRQ